ncbi:uncharacterized protein I303_102083 [Kwoniella dejecticola CBS 10117]|uniref:CFEM domain-containing protein n=1 Tax=Kwoniella dejecticola CBS 10117 TaxID=1296121 RepID=A0A1A6AC01_9TREE|nr:uncharacterized protein I303_01776 [Kwoniella dejecticola CBS 10117]OBR87568.1 hypothetical protein I303_01776 [Kwoniella dejecticola CBS 10117]
MAPSQPNFDTMIRRQSSANATDASTSGVPTCVVSCIASAPTTGCTGPEDWTCLCANTEFINSVGACWTSSCSATDAQYGQAYANQACAFYGVPIGGNGTSTGDSSSTDTQATGSPVLSAPQVMHPSFIRIQAIMSSISSLLMVIAIIMGILSCRARYRRDQMASQNRTWNGVTGLTTMDSKAPTTSKKSRFFNRSTHSSAFENSRGGLSQTETFGVTSSNFGGSTTLAGSPNHTQSFGGAAGLTYPSNAATTSPRDQDRFSGGGVGGGTRFTNRLNLNEMANKSEEWEMDDVKMKNNNDSFVIDGLSPTSFDSKMESELESSFTPTEGGMDSTVALNVLPKEGSGNGRTHAL